MRLTCTGTFFKYNVALCKNVSKHCCIFFQKYIILCENISKHRCIFHDPHSSITVNISLQDNVLYHLYIPTGNNRIRNCPTFCNHIIIYVMPVIFMTVHYRHTKYPGITSIHKPVRFLRTLSQTDHRCIQTMKNILKAYHKLFST